MVKSLAPVLFLVVACRGLVAQDASTSPGTKTTSSIVVGRGAYPGGGGQIDVFAGARGEFALEAHFDLRWDLYNAANGATRVAAGDVDGDGRDEIVAGLGTYTASGGWLCVFGDGAADYALLRWIRVPWSTYNAADGETRPAVGDIDGDGKDEVVVGFGTSSISGGWMCVFDDARESCRIQRWLKVPWPRYDSANGETNPALGDLDGDGREELVVGLGTYPTEGGWCCVFEDAVAGHVDAGWMRVGWGGFNSANGEVLPALGDVDGDGLDEVVMGLGSYPSSGGWLCVYDDSSHDRAFLRWLRMPRSEYNAMNGETRPALGNLDTDASDEIVIGMGTHPTDGGWVIALDDASTWNAPLSSMRTRSDSYNVANGETWPTIAR